MKLTDGKRTVEIEMLTWDNNKGQYVYDDYAPYFFGGVDGEYAMRVEDVDYCIGQAEDWEKCRWDFVDDELAEGEERVVRVTEIAADKED